MIVWVAVAVVGLATLVVAARLISRPPRPAQEAAEPALAVQDSDDSDDLADYTDDTLADDVGELDTSGPPLVLPGSSALVAEYQVRVDFLLGRTDRVRQALADADELGADEKAELDDVKAQLGEARRLVSAMAKAPSKEAQDRTQAALDGRLADIRDQLDDLEP